MDFSIFEFGHIHCCKEGCDLKSRLEWQTVYILMRWLVMFAKGICFLTGLMCAFTMKALTKLHRCTTGLSFVHETISLILFDKCHIRCIYTILKRDLEACMAKEGQAQPAYLHSLVRPSMLNWPRWLSWMRRPTGDQEVTGSTPAEVGNILSWRLIMKYFLRSFSPFRWFKKGSCQFLAKECAQYWLTT